MVLGEAVIRSLGQLARVGADGCDATRYRDGVGHSSDPLASVKSHKAEQNSRKGKLLANLAPRQRLKRVREA